MYFSQRVLKNGRVRVESKKPAVGTSAFIQGSIPTINFKYKAIARYVKIPTRIFLVQLISHDLFSSTSLFRFSILETLSSKSSIFAILKVLYQKFSDPNFLLTVPSARGLDHSPENSGSDNQFRKFNYLRDGNGRG